MAALAAGELHGKIVRQMLHDLRAANGDRHRAAIEQLHRLESQGAIRLRERRALTELLAAFDEPHSVDRVTDIHERLVDDDDTSPVALAISSIGASSVNPASEIAEAARDAGTDAGGGKKNVGKADVEGAIGGAGAGATIAGAGGATGPGGAAAGAFFGGLLGGAAMSFAELLG